MSDPNPTVNRGGPDTHRNPDCKCNACVARRRKAKAQLNGAGQPAADTTPAIPPDKAEAVILSDIPQHTRGVMRDRIKKWLQWKAIEPKLTHREAAARMGIAEQTLTNIIYKASKEGWLKFEDPLAELEYEIIPKVTQNLKYYLDQHDKDVTIKTAQGTLFKQFQDAKGITQAAPQTTVLAFKIEIPPGGPATVAAGHIVGTPRRVDVKSEIVDAEVVSEPKP